jgi:hypothetical protein
VIAMLAAMIFPYRRPQLYQSSPLARLRPFGIPLMTVTGFLGAGFLGIYLYLLWTDPIAAGPMIKNPLHRVLDHCPRKRPRRHRRLPEAGRPRRQANSAGRASTESGGIDIALARYLP